MFGWENDKKRTGGISAKDFEVLEFITEDIWTIHKWDDLRSVPGRLSESHKEHIKNIFCHQLSQEITVIGFLDIEKGVHPKIDLVTGEVSQDPKAITELALVLYDQYEPTVHLSHFQEDKQAYHMVVRPPFRNGETSENKSGAVHYIRRIFGTTSPAQDCNYNLKQVTRKSQMKERSLYGETCTETTPSILKGSRKHQRR